MKAITVYPSLKEVRLDDLPEPKLQTPTQAKVRILDVGICGTDREICSFQYGTPPDGSDRLVLGHESLGEVVETGAGVTSVKVGDLVVTMVRRPCGDPDCVPCAEKRADFCSTGNFTERGIKGRDGFMTEFIVEEEAYLVPVPAGLRGLGVLAEPLTIAEKAQEQVWDIQDRLPWNCRHDGHPRPGPEGPSGNRHRAVVLGAGPVGLLGAMVLCQAGFKVTVFSKETADSPKAAWVRGGGAAYVSGSTTSLEGLVKAAGPVDLVYEATGASGLSFAMLPYLGVNGIFLFTGVPGRKATISVDTDLLMRNLVLKNQVVVGTVNAGKGAYEAAVRDLASFQKRWPGAVEALITARHAPEKFRDCLLGPVEGIKNVIAFG